MKILYLVNIDWFFASHRLPIALSAIQHGDSVYLASAFTDKLKYLQGLGVECIPIHLDRGNLSIFSFIKTFSQTFGLVVNLRPDVIHLVTIKPILIGGVVARLLRVPSLVVAISGLGHVFTSTGLLASARRAVVVTFYKFVLNHPNVKVIFQNQDDLEMLARLTSLHRSKIKLIRGSGADLSIYQPKPFDESSPVVLMAARLLIDKGFRVFAEAAKILIDDFDVKNIKPKFVIVGEPDPSNPKSLTLDEVNKWVADGLVEYWGFQSDMPAVIAKAQIVTLPSFYGEGLPKVLIEAAACARAVITTDHPGCRDAIDPGVTGLLVPVKDSLALAEAIKRLLLDPLLCKKMGVEGRKFAEKEFDVKSVVQQHNDIYQDLFQNAKGSVL